jgi:hypothetical protein
VKTLTGFALGTFLTLGTITSAFAAGTSGVAPVKAPPTGIEVIVVTAKRPTAQPVDEPIYEVVVTAKRTINASTNRTPPVMAIDMPKLDLAVSDSVIRL